MSFCRVGNGTRLPQELVGRGNAAWWWAIMQAPPDREQRKTSRVISFAPLAVCSYLQMASDALQEREKKKIQFSRMKKHLFRSCLVFTHRISEESTCEGGQRSHRVPGGSWWGLRWRWPCRSLWCPGCRWWRVAACCWCHRCSSASGFSDFICLVKKRFLGKHSKIHPSIHYLNPSTHTRGCCPWPDW